MKYKGKELKEITTPQVFDPPKNMIVWGDCVEPEVQLVYAVVRTINGTTQAVGNWRWQYCAEIPEEPKPRRATIRELSKWLAQGNGEYKTGTGLILTSFTYYISWQMGEPVDSAYTVRRWEDTEWHEPTVDYMGIEDNLAFDHNVTPEWIEGELLPKAYSDPDYFKENEVKIGNQIWMNKNLDIIDGGEGIYFNKDNGEWYYTWEAAKRIADKIHGWHLPSREEWNELVEATGNDGANLRDKSWGGTNKYGFSAVPAGYWDDGFLYVSSETSFWTSDHDDSFAWDRCIHNGLKRVDECEHIKYFGLSVRLVKDK